MLRSAKQHASSPPADLLDRDAWRAVREKARWLVRRGGFAASDRPDIEQELAIQLWRGLPRYDPARGSRHGFVATILRRGGRAFALAPPSQ